MNLDEKMRVYKREVEVKKDEEKIEDTIRKSKEIFYLKEQTRMLTYWEFLRTQVYLIQKRWWILQTLLLGFVGCTISSMEDEFFVQRSMGIAGVLFVVLVIPELWKNRTTNCMEIETASYYSLRQIYASRILLFGMVDIFLLTVFCVVLHGRFRITFIDLLVQFLFPMAVTACICFGLFCNKYAVSETISIVLCLVWSAVWWMITYSEKIYTAIIVPVWMSLFVIALLLLILLIYKALHNEKQCWEEKNGHKNN